MSGMTTELQKAQRKWRSKRNAIEKDILPVCEQVISKYRTDEAVEEAKGLIEALEDGQKEVRVLDEVIADLTQEEVDLETHEREACKYGLKLRKMQAKLRGFVEKPERMASEMEIGTIRKTGVKLPKMTIKCFDGDVMQWKSFLDSYNAAVHDRDDITDVEKLIVLIL